MSARAAVDQVVNEPANEQIEGKANGRASGAASRKATRVSSLRRSLLTPLLAGWVLGTAAQLRQSALFGLEVYACFSALALVLYALIAIKTRANDFRNDFRSDFLGDWRSVARMVLALACTASMAFALCGLRAVHFERQALAAELEGRDIQVVGVVSAMPQRHAGGARFRFAVESARLVGAGEVRLPPLIYLGYYSEPGASTLPDLQPGQRWQWVVRLKAPHGNSNPRGFDYELWLWEQGLQATGHVRTARTLEAPRLLAQTWRHPLEQARAAVRDAIFAAVPERRAAGIIAALVVGDQGAIERADWDVFRATGVAHLMSISGLHVTLFAWLAGWLVGRLWRRSTGLCLRVPAPHAAFAGGVLLATAYALFSGWGVPSQRTVVMLATVALLRWQGRRWPWPVVWLLAVAVVLAWDPWALLQAGFWLSFVAVAVLFASDPAPAHDPAEKPSSVEGRSLAVRILSWPAAWLAPLKGLLREQAVVTLALTPLTLLLFGQFSVVGLFANLLAIPWVTLVVTPLAMLGALWTPVWSLCAVSLYLLDLLLQPLAGLPFATYSIANPAIWAGAMALFGGILMVLRLPWAFRLMGLPLVLPVLLWQAPRPAAGEFEVVAADVGQGTAVLLRTASHSLLYDAGPRYGPESDAGHRVLVPLLRSLDERLDLLLLSHRDSDHTGGAASILAMQPQSRVLGSLEAGHEINAARPIEPCVAGQRWQWDGVDFEILHPRPLDYAQAQAGQLKPNGLSCVLRVTSAANPGPAAVRRSALLTGDIEAAQEAALLAGSDSSAGAAVASPLQADLLLVPHHGSKTSSSAAFLEAVAPRFALLQAGYRNRYGHPADAVSARYQALGIPVLDSVHCGAATWSSAEPGQVKCQRQQAPRYWQHRPP